MHQGRNAMSSFLSKEPPLGERASRSSSSPSKKLRVVLLAAPALLAVTQFLRTQVDEFLRGPLKTRIQVNFDFESTVPERFELALEELPTHACTRQRVRQPPAGQPGRLEPDLPLLGRTALPHTTTLLNSAHHTQHTNNQGFIRFRVARQHQSGIRREVCAVFRRDRR